MFLVPFVILLILWLGGFLPFTVRERLSKFSSFWP